MTRARLRIPHTLVLLAGMMVLAWLLTLVLPQGAFQTVANEAGRQMVVAGTYTEAEERTWLGPQSLLTVVPRALADAQDIIFFVLIIGGVLAVVRATGAFDALLGSILRRIGHRPGLLIGLGLFTFAAASGTIGMAEEYIPFVLILVGLCVAMRMDAVTAMGIMVCGYGIGYGVAAINPFTVLVAQGVAGVEPASGLGLRLAILPLFVAVGVHHVWRYARRVQADPAASLVAGVESAQHVAPASYPAMTVAHRAVLLSLLGGIVLLVVGISRWGWYLTELAAVFLGVGLLAAVFGRLGADRTAKTFALGASELATTALLIGFARSIAMLLEDGQVLHTIVHALSVPLSMVGAELAAVGMLLIQTVLNLFIPSGSGQAFVTMPIMAPIGDIVGISRQASVLAFQFGDGFSNMIVPTNPVLMGILGIAGIPYDRWFRFAFPLLLKLTALAAVVMVGAVMAGWQ